MKDRILNLNDISNFTQNLCALTEMKETDHNSNPELECRVPMGENWDLLAEQALLFAEQNQDREWDGEWYENIEVYYMENVRPKLFVL